MKALGSDKIVKKLQEKNMNHHSVFSTAQYGSIVPLCVCVCVCVSSSLCTFSFLMFTSCGQEQLSDWHMATDQCFPDSLEISVLMSARCL